MSGHLDLVDEQDAADLRTFLLRARRLDSTAVRLAAGGSVLAVTVCTRAGSGLMGEGTVLGLRAFALAQEAEVDAVVGIDAVLDRLARLTTGEPGPRRLAVPPVPMVEAWAGQSAPRSGWEPVGALTGEQIDAIATDGIAEVTAGRAVALREQVWSRPIPGTSVPAAAALAVHTLGFTAPEVGVYAQGRWHRLSTPAGHVLTR